MTSESRSEFERTFLARARARGFDDPGRLLGRNSSGEGYMIPSTESAWVGWCWAIESQRMTSVGIGDGTRRAVVDWNELSRRGVLTRINEMLQAEGLAVMRVVETGTSPGAMVLEELVGLLQRVYDADQAARHEKPYNVSKLMDDIEKVLQRHQQ